MRAVILGLGICCVLGAALAWLGLHSRMCMKSLPRPDFEILSGELSLVVLAGRFVKRMRRVVLGRRGQGLWRVSALYGLPVAFIMGLEAGAAPALSAIDILLFVALVAAYIFLGCAGLAFSLRFSFGALPRKSDPVGDVWNWATMLSLALRCGAFMLLVGPVRTMVCASMFVIVITRDPGALVNGQVLGGVLETGISRIMLVENLLLLLPCALVLGSVSMAASLLGARDLHRVAVRWFMQETADRHKRQSMQIAMQMCMALGIGLIAIAVA